MILLSLPVWGARGRFSLKMNRDRTNWWEWKSLMHHVRVGKLTFPTPIQRHCLMNLQTKYATCWENFLYCYAASQQIPLSTARSGSISRMRKIPRGCTFFIQDRALSLLAETSNSIEVLNPYIRNLYRC